MDERLRVVFNEIKKIYDGKYGRPSASHQAADGSCHLDIGSDHGLLLRTLLRQQIVNRGIAVEKTKPPYLNSQRALAELDADVRLGNGFSVVGEGEATSLSMSGIGGATIREVLLAHPERVPKFVTLQANNHPELLRHWAIKSGFRIAAEHLTDRLFLIMTFVAQDESQSSAKNSDDAYDEFGLEAGLEFGPLLLNNRDPSLMARLCEERIYLNNLKSLCDNSRRRLQLIENLAADGWLP